MSMPKFNRGFSLIEIVLVIGIGSVVTAGIYTMLQNLIEQQGALDSKMDLRIMTEEIRASLADPNTCRATFDPAFRYNNAQAVQVTPGGQVLSGLVLPSTEVVRPGQTLRRYALIVDDLRLANAVSVSPNVYRVAVEGKFRSSKGRNLLFRPEVISSVTLTVNAGGVIASCVGANGPPGGGGSGPAISEAMAQQTCAIIGGGWYSGSWGGVCTLCPNGSPLYGFRYDSASGASTPTCGYEASQGN